MTRLIEVIETTRLIYPTDNKNIPVHQHHQHVNPDGGLIVEWCEFDDDCGYVKGTYDDE